MTIERTRAETVQTIAPSKTSQLRGDLLIFSSIRSISAELASWRKRFWTKVKSRQTAMTESVTISPTHVLLTYPNPSATSNQSVGEMAPMGHVVTKDQEANQDVRDLLAELEIRDNQVVKEKREPKVNRA